jgi:transposase-like protein
MHSTTPSLDNASVVSETAQKIIFDKLGVFTILKEQGIRALLFFIMQAFFQMLAEFNLSLFLEEHKDEYVPGTNKRRYVRNGYYRKRKIFIYFGISIIIRIPRYLDRLRKIGHTGSFYEGIVPLYQRTSEAIKNYALYLYILGISLKKISTAMKNIFGEKVPGMNISSLSARLSSLLPGYEAFFFNDLSSFKDHIIVIDATYVKSREKKNKIAILSVVVLDVYGNCLDSQNFKVKIGQNHQVIGWRASDSESEENWKEFFLHLTKKQGMGQPRMVITDGGPGALAAIAAVFPEALVQRCWVHKIRNVLSYLPRRLYQEASTLLKNIHNAPTYEEAIEQIKIFSDVFFKYPQAVNCIINDVECLLNYFKIDDYEKVKIYTSNIIESIYSVVKLNFNPKRGGCKTITILLLTFQYIKHFTPGSEINGTIGDLTMGAFT